MKLRPAIYGRRLRQTLPAVEHHSALPIILTHRQGKRRRSKDCTAVVLP